MYIIVAINPKKKKKKLEVFFPIFSEFKLIPEIFVKILKFLYGNSLVDFSEKFNLAFVDQDSTVVYYCLVFNIHSLFGPSI
jgi:hypothetical protein